MSQEKGYWEDPHKIPKIQEVVRGKAGKIRLEPGGRDTWIPS